MKGLKTMTESNQDNQGAKHAGPPEVRIEVKRPIDDKLRRDLMMFALAMRRANREEAMRKAAPPTRQSDSPAGTIDTSA